MLFALIFAIISVELFEEADMLAAGIILLVAAIVACAACCASAFTDDDGEQVPFTFGCFIVTIVCAIVSPILIHDSAEGFPVYYMDNNGLESGSYRVVGLFEDNGRPYLAAVKDGDDRVKVFALYAPLPAGTKRIKVNEGKTGPERISVDNSVEEGGGQK